MQAGHIQLKLIADIADLQAKMREVEKMMGGTTQQFLEAQKAAEQMNRAMAGVNTSALQQASKHIDQVGVSARQTANAMRMIPMQMTDIATSLAGGMSPFTVLMQQGGQLKDSFGGVGAALKGVGQYMMGLPGAIMSLVNPYTAAAAAAVAMAVAIHQAAKEQETLRNAIATTGNAAGVSVDQLNAMAANMASAWGVTSGQATDALAAMVQTGQVGRASLEGYAQTAMLVEKKFGTSIEKTAEHFAQLGKDPVGASKRLNESMNYLSASTYEQIRAAMALGDQQKAAAIAQDAYDKALKQQAANATENLGYVERAWRGIIDAALWAWKAMKEVWDWIKSLGREDPIAVQIKKIQSELDLVDKGLRNVSTRQEEAMRTQLANLQETERLQKRSGDAAIERAAREKQGIDEVDKKFKEQEETRKKAQQAAEAAARAQQQLVDSGVKLYGDLIAKESGLAGDFAEKWSQLSAAYAAGRLNVTQLTEAQAALLAMQPAMVKAREAEEALIKRINDEQVRAVAESWKKAEATQQQIDQQRKANETYGMGKSALAELTLAELEHQMVALQATDRVMPGYIESLQQRIDKQRELIGVLKQGETIDANAKAAQQAAEEWKRAAEQINRSLTDALMRGFESGKSFAQNLRDAVVNLFNTMVLRPVVQFVVGGTLGALGLPNMAAAATGGTPAGGGLLNLGNTLSNLYQGGMNFLTGASIKSGVAGAWTRAGDWLSTSSNNTLAGAGNWMQANPAMANYLGMAGNALAGYGIQKGLSGGYKVGDGKVVDALTVAASAYFGPIAGAAAGVFNRAFGMKAKQVTGSGLTGTFSADEGASVQSYTDWFQKGGWFRRNRSGRNYSAISGELDQFMDDAIGMMASATREYGRVVGLSADAINGYSKAISISLQGLDAAGREKAIAGALSDFGDDLARLMLGASGVALRRQGETASDALARLATSLVGVNKVLNSLGQTILSTNITAADAASKLADLFGGVDSMVQSAGSYLQAYYTDMERFRLAQESLGTTLAQAGVDMPKTTQAYRALVEAQDLNTEAGRRAYATLMQLAPAFAEMTNGIQAQLDGMIGQRQQLIEQVLGERDGLIDSILSALGRTGAMRERELSRLDPVNRPLQAFLYALEDARTASQALAAAQISASEAQEAFSARLVNAGAGLASFISTLRSGMAGGGANAGATYAADLASARAGDIAASERLPASAQAYLDVIRSRARSATEVDIAMSRMAAELESLPATMGWAEQQLKELEKINAAVTDGSAEMVKAQAALQTALVDALTTGFAGLDLNVDGVLTFDELTRGLAGLASADQIRQLIAAVDSNGDGQISRLESVTAATRAVDDNTAGLLDGSDSQVLEMRRMVAATDTNSSLILQLNGSIYELTAEVAAQNEDRRKAAQLAAVEITLEGLAKERQAMIDSVNAGIDGIWKLAGAYGLYLNADAGEYSPANTAQFKVNTDGLFEAVYNSISLPNGGDASDFKRVFYSPGGVYDQTYGMADELIAAKQKLEAARQAVRDMGGVPRFASGGYHAGGLRLVGEQGPEIEFTGPSYIANAQQTLTALQGGNNAALVAEMRALRTEMRAEMEGLRAEARATAINTQKTAVTLNRVTQGTDTILITQVAA